MATKIGTAYVDVKGDFTQLHQGVATALAPAQMGKFGKAGGVAAGAAMGGAVAAALGGAVVTKALYDLGSQFDEAFDRIRVGTGKQGKALRGLEKDFKAVYKTVPSGMNDVADSIAGVNKRLGLTGKPLQKMARNISELSRITDTDLEGNIRGITRAFVDWEVPVKKQVKTLDGFYRLSQKSGAAVGDLTSDVQKFGSPLRTLGFSIGEAGSMFALFEKAGVNAQTMVPGFKLAIGNLVKPTNDMKKTFKELGVVLGNPEKGLKQIMKLLGNSSDLSKVEKMSVAMDVFGKRAGADMAEAIKQGRFNLKSYVDEFKNGKDTIRDSAKDTNDAGENFKILGHKIQVALEPISGWVHDSFGDFSKVLADLKINKWIGQFQRFTKTNQDFKDVLNVVKGALKVVGAVARVAFDTMKEKFKAAWQILKGGLLALKGLVKVVTGVFTGDWKKAWSGVKDMFRGGVKMVLGQVRWLLSPFKAALRALAKPLKSIFTSAWDAVESVFTDGGNAIIAVINKIIEAINLIPGIPDIEPMGSIGGGGKTTESGGRSTAQKRGKYQRGGDIRGGKPSGDSVPALLERGEYVLNREAVKTVGVSTLDNINFKKAKRFQTGGPIGMIGGGLLDKSKEIGADLIGKSASMGADLFGKGPDFFIGKLPEPNLPDPFEETGPYLIERVTDWIKEKVDKPAKASGGSWSSGPGNYPGVTGDTDFRPELGNALSAMSKSVGQSIYVQSGNRTYAEQVALYQAYLNGTGNLAAVPGTSNHEGGRAADITPGSEVFGSAAGRFGMGFTVPGESWHIELLRLGGFIKMLRGGSTEHGVVRTLGSDLLKHGFDFRAACGIIGNAWQEGLWNPAQMEMTGYDNGGLYGFTAYEKSMASLREYASSIGKPWDDAIVQNHFMLRTGGNSIKGAMNATDTIAQAAELFMNEYERPAAATADLANRIGAGHDASKILRAAGITKAGDAGEDAGPTAKETAAAKRKKLKQSRTGKLKELFDAVKGSKTTLGKQGSLWDLIRGWGKFGEFDSKEQGTILDKVRRAASTTNPLGNLPILQNLSQLMRKKGEVSGDEELDERFFDKLMKVKDKGEDRGDAKRKKVWKKLGLKGVNFPLKDDLVDNDNLIATLMEQHDIAERMASSETSPGGSEYTDEEVHHVRFPLFNLLKQQQRRKGMLTRSIGHVEGNRTHAQLMVDMMSGKRPKLLNAISQWRPKKWLNDNAWKLPGYKKAVRNAETTLGNKFNGDGLRGNLADLVGLTGDGGAIFDTKMSLADLGATVTVEGAAAAEKDSELLAIMREQLGLANRNNAILSAQNPIFQQFMPKFHDGGVYRAPLGQSEGPAMLRDGEHIFTPEAMAGGATFNLYVNGVKADPAQVRMEVANQGGAAASRVRRGNVGAPKYRTAGLR